MSSYLPKRTIQKLCNSNSPLPNDTKGIERCLDYYSFNSTYSKIPLILSLKGFSLKNLHNTNSGYYVAETEFSLINQNPLPVNLIDISYKIIKNGTKLVSGNLSESLILCYVCSGTIEPMAIGEFIDSQVFRVPRDSNIISSNIPFIIEGRYEYGNSSLGIVSKQFNLTPQ